MSRIVLGHGDAGDDLRFHISGEGEYHGRRHYECGHGAGLRALRRRELERHAFHHSVTRGGHWPELEMSLQIGKPFHHKQSLVWRGRCEVFVLQNPSVAMRDEDGV